MPIPDTQEVFAQLEQGQADELLVRLEYLADLLPTSAPLHVLMAHAHEAASQWREALHAWQWALFLMPNSPAIQTGLRHAARALAAPPGTVAPRPLADLAGALPALSQSAASAATPVATPPAEPPVAQPESVTGHTPPEPPTDEAPQRFDDLDRLIGELESARIVPEPDLDRMPTPDLEDEIEDVVSETLARIYAAQHQYDEAARVYELLAAQQPGRASEYLQQASEMRARAADR